MRGFGNMGIGLILLDQIAPRAVLAQTQTAAKPMIFWLDYIGTFYASNADGTERHTLASGSTQGLDGPDGTHAESLWKKTGAASFTGIVYTLIPAAGTSVSGAARKHSGYLAPGIRGGGKDLLGRNHRGKRPRKPAVVASDRETEGNYGD